MLKTLLKVLRTVQGSQYGLRPCPLLFLLAEEEKEAKRRMTFFCRKLFFGRNTGSRRFFGGMTRGVEALLMIGLWFPHGLLFRAYDQ